MKLSNEGRRYADAVERLEKQLKAYKKAVATLMLATDTTEFYLPSRLKVAISALYKLNNEVDRQGW